MDRQAVDAERFRDDDTERLILGGVLVQPEHLDVYRQFGLAAEDFAHPIHRGIYGAMLHASARGEQPDPPAVVRALRDAGRDGEISPVFVFKLTDGMPIQAAENMRALTDRVRIFRRCRDYWYDSERVRERLAADPAGIDNGVLSEHVERIRQLTAETRGTNNAIELLSIDEVFAISDPGQLVKGLLFDQTLIQLWGDYGIGKTYLTLDLACCLVANRPWLGHRIVKVGSVVYLMAEGAARLKNRLRTWMEAHAVSPEQLAGFHVIPHAIQLLQRESVEALLRRIRDIHPVLVVFDTQARCTVGADENATAYMGIVVDAVERIRTELATSVLLVHHPNKAGTSSRGSNSVAAGIDTELQLTEANDLLTLACVKQKDGTEWDPIQLCLVPQPTGGCVVRLACDAPARTSLNENEVAVLRELRDVLGGSARTEELKRSLPAMKSRTADRALQVLAGRGLVQKGSKHTDPYVLTAAGEAVLSDLPGGAS